MVLKLDRRFPLVWRSPHALQLGVDNPMLVIDEVTGAQEQLLAALVVGVSRSGLEMIARMADATTTDVDRLLTQVAAALETRGWEAATATIEGSGPTAEMLRAMLGDANPRFVVIIAQHVINPDDHGRWLRQDVPHLPVVYGDSLVHIGPIVEPGTGPCLYCLELHHTDADSAWPAISAQLWGRATAAESALVASETASIVARLVHARVQQGEPGRAISIDLDPATGERVSVEWTQHPRCQCAGVTAVQPESAMASARLIDPIPFSPKTNATPAVRA